VVQSIFFERYAGTSSCSRFSADSYFYATIFTELIRIKSATHCPISTDNLTVTAPMAVPCISFGKMTAISSRSRFSVDSTLYTISSSSTSEKTRQHASQQIIDHLTFTAPTAVPPISFEEMPQLRAAFLFQSSHILTRFLH
jgi:hypothetical protein